MWFAHNETCDGTCTNLHLPPSDDEDFDSAPYYEQPWYREQMEAAYTAPMEPVYPCRRLTTRHCPIIFGGVCGDERPCARYESDDESPWLAELTPHGIH